MLLTNGACGLLVTFGDGTSQQYRAENNSLPVRLTHTYSISGNVTVAAEGKLYMRGLNSVLGCFGSNQSFIVAVRHENLSEREAQDLAAKAEALKRAAAERRAAEQAPAGGAGHDKKWTHLHHGCAGVAAATVACDSGCRCADGALPCRFRSGGSGCLGLACGRRRVAAPEKMWWPSS